MRFFFNDTATTEIYTLSLHDALPIWPKTRPTRPPAPPTVRAASCRIGPPGMPGACWTTGARASRPPTSCTFSRRRSEEHTSELQSRQYLVCRLLLEKKKPCKPQHDRK